MVIGGGHAGAEAAWAAANLGARVALLTLDPAKIGVMSCNPAIGGLAKGQIVREIDALGGLMGIATDRAGIQFRVLNTSKGPAVRGPRAQCDKHAYAEAVQELLASRPEIEILTGSCEEILVDRGAVRGLIWQDPTGQRQELLARAVVLTTGTFMRGLMHTGDAQTPGGRFGEDAAVGISANLAQLGFELGRLKTGTPPRLSRPTIDWEGLTPQYGDADPTPFSDHPHDFDTAAGATGCLPTSAGRSPHHSYLAAGFTPSSDPRRNQNAGQAHAAKWDGSHHTSGATGCVPTSAGSNRFPHLPQVECRMTETNPAIHDLIRANLHRAPIFSGQIDSVGPRYCPSIEDKIVRFEGRDEHHVFLEPESHRDDWVYCNGISTSLPADVQREIVRRLPGCERAEIRRFGYAVEYDMVQTHQIDSTCMTKRLDGFFLAGQINGTSGYEEAAGQGLLAGLNAVRFARGLEPVRLGRDQAYIGVMLDDLATKNPIEPYRMFTSRAEHRLLLRADNAADRLTPWARNLGLIDDARWQRFGARQEWLQRYADELDRLTIDGTPLRSLIHRPEFGVDDAARALGLNGEHRAGSLQKRALLTAFADRQYEGYLVKELAQIKRQREAESWRVPGSLDYEQVTGLRAEARHALVRFQPRTLGQAGRLEGVNPADVTILAVAIKRHRAAAKAAIESRP